MKGGCGWTGEPVGRRGALSPGTDATGGTGWERQGAGHEEAVTNAGGPA